jgi:hypothetical protein
MFPNPYYFPSLFSQLSSINLVPSHSPFNLCLPVFLGWNLPQFFPIIAMPKIAINEYYDFFRWKNDIGLADNFIMKPISTDFIFRQQFPKGHF